MPTLRPLRILSLSLPLPLPLTLACSTRAYVASGPGVHPPEELPALVQDEVVPDRRRREERDEKKNVMGVFLGATARTSDTNGSVGVEYARRLSRLVSLGVLVEYTPDAREEILFGPMLSLFPYRGLRLILSPGVEFEEGDRTSAILRLGVGWEFELEGGFTVSPEVNYDWASAVDDATVFGVTLGYAF